MEIVTVGYEDNPVFLDSFLHCMQEVDAFVEISELASRRGMTLREYGGPVWAACHHSGEVRGIFDARRRLIAFTLYMRLCTIERDEPGAYAALFEPPFPPELLVKMRELGDDMLYLLGIGVYPEYRRQGIAKRMIADITARYGRYGIMADVSGDISLQIYRDYGFIIQRLPSPYPYYFVFRKPPGGLSNEGII
ncbi:MAG: GNAT family N-acetyltransferase [Symbiobacteriaceae bacterium]|nr:GNAT family N-acetyltransferase [Symbiobacteriaceae bacterium]